MLARISIVSPSATFSVDSREEFLVKVAVIVGDAEKGPESIRFEITKPKQEKGVAGTFSFVPQQRDKSYELDAKLRAPKDAGIYTLRCIGTYQLQGTDEAQITHVVSESLNFEVNK